MVALVECLLVFIEECLIEDDEEETAPAVDTVCMVASEDRTVDPPAPPPPPPPDSVHEDVQAVDQLEPFGLLPPREEGTTPPPPLLPWDLATSRTVVGSRRGARARMLTPP